MKQTRLARYIDFKGYDFPGFGGQHPLEGATTLTALADRVREVIGKTQVRLVIAHSVASIIASLAIRGLKDHDITLVSLEGNLTKDDAYYSGRAAKYDNAARFKAEFVSLMQEKSLSSPILKRYARMAEKADATAMWELGCDAHRFSQTHHPGELLEACGRVIYVYNPDNCAKSSMDWLAGSGLDTLRLDGASHWPTIDVPGRLSERLMERLLNDVI
ncbi:MAG: alpha/beta hydrolase [Alphaproteobacteria bacterium]|nr:alpha/beta hydrolase [Alphaproteobacteria bacterium]